jgi:hypothetical protein
MRVLGALDWDDYVERVDDSRPLYLMRAGRFDDSYGERVDRLDWDALFCACPALFRSFRRPADAARFAHVLVDCRSGRSAATSVCTGCCRTSWWPCSARTRAAWTAWAAWSARARLPLQPRGRAAPAAGVSAGRCFR